MGAIDQYLEAYDARTIPAPKKPGSTVEDYLAAYDAKARQPKKRGGLIEEYLEKYDAGVFKHEYPGNVIPTPGLFSPEVLKAQPWLKGAMTTAQREKAKLQLVDKYEEPEEVKPNWFWRVINKLVIPNAFFAGIAGGAEDALHMGNWDEAFKRGMASAGAMWRNKPEEAEFFKDVLVQLGMKDRKDKVDVSDVAGLLMDVFLDPTTYMGVGAVGKLGKGAGILAKFAKGGKIAEEIGKGTRVLPHLSKLAKGGKVSRKALELAQSGFIAPTMYEQAQLGQRALLKIGGYPVWKAPGFWAKYEPVAMAARDLPVIKQISKTFNPLYHIAPELAHGERLQFKSVLNAAVGDMSTQKAEVINTAVKALKGLDDTTQEAVGLAIEFKKMGYGPKQLRNFLDTEKLAPEVKTKLEDVYRVFAKNPATVETAASTLSKNVFQPYKARFAEIGIDTRHWDDFYIKHLLEKRTGKDAMDYAMGRGGGAFARTAPSLKARLHKVGDPRLSREGIPLAKFDVKKVGKEIYNEIPETGRERIGRLTAETRQSKTELLEKINTLKKSGQTFEAAKLGEKVQRIETRLQQQIRAINDINLVKDKQKITKTIERVGLHAPSEFDRQYDKFLGKILKERGALEKAQVAGKEDLAESIIERMGDLWTEWEDIQRGLLEGPVYQTAEKTVKKYGKRLETQEERYRRLFNRYTDQRMRLLNKVHKAQGRWQQTIAGEAEQALEGLDRAFLKNYGVKDEFLRREAGGVLQETAELRRAEGLLDLFREGYVPNLHVGEVTQRYVDEAEKMLQGVKFTNEVLDTFGVPITLQGPLGKALKGVPKVVSEGTGDIWIARETLKRLKVIQQLPEGLAKRTLDDHLIRLSADEAASVAKAAGETLKGYILPEGVAQQMNRYFKVAGGSDSSFEPVKKIWGAYMTMFKRYALGMPGTQARNAMGGILNSFYQGVVNPVHYGKAIKESFEAVLGGKVSEHLNLMQRMGAGGIRTAEFGQLSRLGRMNKAQRAFGHINPFGVRTENVYLKKMRQTMEIVESSLRLANFKHHLAAGWNPRGAALKVIESQFDYAPHAFSDFSNNLRANWFPFFSWTFNNLPYQAKKLLTEPGLYAVPAKVMAHMERASPETWEEREFRRPYFSELLVKPVPKAVQNIFQPWLARLGMKHEGTYYLNPNFPFQDMAKFADLSMSGLGKEILSMLNPVAKFIMEGVPYAVGGRSMDFFSGKRLSEGDMDIAPAYMQFAWRNIPPARPLIQRLGAIENREGVLRISPMMVKALETFAPPLMLPRRYMPREEDAQKYMNEPGRLNDLYIASMLSNLLGVKFILPAVEGEKQARVYKEKERVQAQYKKWREDYEFPPFKRGETPEAYKQRVRAGNY